MTAGLLAVLASAVASGAATVLQARAARATEVRPGVDATLLVRLARRRSYLAALALMVLGFALSLWAMRSLPLFVVQAGRASSLAVAAVLAALVLGARLARRDVVALVAVAGGLVALAGTAGTSAQAREVPLLLVLAVVVAVVLAAIGAGRLPSPRRTGLAVAVLAGVAFALMALSARGLAGTDLAALPAEPAAWLVVGAGVVGAGLAATALQRAAVVPATALLVGTETCLGAVLGVVVAGDRWADGSAPRAALGFALVLLGALALARFSARDGSNRPSDAVGAAPAA